MAIHWNGVNGLGINGLILSVNRPLQPTSAMCACVRSASPTIASISSSVSVGSPIII